jgi:hypothetical protein
MKYATSTAPITADSSAHSHPKRDGAAAARTSSHALQPRVDHADERLAKQHRDSQPGKHRADHGIGEAGSDARPGQQQCDGRYREPQPERAAEHGAELFRRTMHDGRHENLCAAHPCNRRQDEQKRIGVLPFAEHVRAEVARQHAADRDRYADLCEALQAKPDKVCDSARDVGIRKTLKRGHPHGNRLLSAGTGGACSL